MACSEHGLVAADLAEAGGDARGLAESVHRAISRALELLQAWIASVHLADAKLILLTEGAVDITAASPPSTAGDVAIGETPTRRAAEPHTAMRASWRRLRSRALCARPALSIPVASASSISTAMRRRSALSTVALASDEPELAVRAGRLLAPRLTRLTAQALRPPAPLDPDGTVLITEDDVHGLGALLARHLASDHGARHVLLVSCAGEQREGAEGLQAQLRELGCEVRIAACDVSKREQLEELLMTVAAEHPLCMAVHTAGPPDDGLIESLDGERLSRALGPKVAGAIHLHELSGQVPLILFSSVAATIGNAGQGGCAAANAFLDALAAHRRAHGLPGVSVAWGVWEQGAEQADELEVAVQTGEDGGLEDPERTVQAGNPTPRCGRISRARVCCRSLAHRDWSSSTSPVAPIARCCWPRAGTRRPCARAPRRGRCRLCCGG